MPSAGPTQSCPPLSPWEGARTLRERAVSIYSLWPLLGAAVSSGWFCTKLAVSVCRHRHADGTFWISPVMVTCHQNSPRCAR